MGNTNLEILAWEETPLGALCLRRRELLSRPGTVITEITLDGEHLMSSYLTASECALAGTALEWHEGRDLRVLVGGLGLGYTADAALASERVASVEVVEFLPQVIEWLEAGLFPLAASLAADERMTVVHGDVYARLAGPPTEPAYDVIIIDVDHDPDGSLDFANAGFYTDDGLRAARAHLRENGILGVWSSAESPEFVAALKRVFAEVRVESLDVVNDLVDVEYTNTLFFARG
jgi:spermidine synthase